MHLAWSSSASGAIHSKNGQEDLRRNQRVCQAMIPSRHGQSPQQRPSRCADALHDQQTARGGHELTFANGVIHIRHHDAVSRDDRPTKNGGAQVQYPARRLVRYKSDNREQGCGGRERRGDDDKASVEAVRKPADRPSQEEPALSWLGAPA